MFSSQMRVASLTRPGIAEEGIVGGGEFVKGGVRWRAGLDGG